MFTGFRNKQSEKILEDIGCKITSSVSKNTDLVIAEDPNDNSNKVLKAKELGIEIMSKDKFIDKTVLEL